MVIINSSPTITLAKIGKLGLLHMIFSEAIITEQVYKEIMSKPTSPEAIAVKKAVEDDKWLEIQKSDETYQPLGAGESSSIDLALKLNQPLIIDDKKAAFVANSVGIECHGTLYIVLEALKRGIIKNKQEAIDIVGQLINNNLYLSAETLSEFYSLLNKVEIQ